MRAEPSPARAFPTNGWRAPPALLLLRGDPGKPFPADTLAQSALWVRWLRPPVEAALRQLAEARAP